MDKVRLLERKIELFRQAVGLLKEANRELKARRSPRSGDQLLIDLAKIPCHWPDASFRRSEISLKKFY